MTAHNEAKKEDIAKTVLMPGDPLRAKYIAENYLEEAKLVNKVRGMLAYTGNYKGKRVTVMASGMGMPSIGIYSYELFKFYDVDTIIRIGSIGGYDESLKVFDIVLALEAYSDSSFAYVQNGTKNYIMKADMDISNKIMDKAKGLNISINQGRIYSTDVFYHENDNIDYYNKKLSCLGTEMEAFALFHMANVCGKKAACLATVSNHLRTKEELPASVREKSFDKMIKLALEAIK